MKIFFSLLLLTNIAFALVQWLFPYDWIAISPPVLEAAEKLRLLEEVETLSRDDLDQLVQSESLVQTEPVIFSGDLCYTLGPFKEQLMAQEVAAEFIKSDISIHSRASLEQEYLGMMVYIGGHKNRQQARRTAKLLTKKGLNDYIMFSDEDKPNALSLGVFGLKKYADRRFKRAAELGFPVKSEPRYRNRTIYWLDYTETENEGPGLYIEKLKSNQGISRIARQCE